MKGKVCMITGATSGIGKVTAMELAKRGATVIVAGRNREKCESCAGVISEETGNKNIDYMLADLSKLDDVRQLAEQFREKHKRLHVLINNAGLVNLKRHETADGFEMTFGVNHLSHFLLTNLLLDTIKASAPARIINVSSGAHKMAKMNFDDLNSEKGYSAMKVYGMSKLANILFTYELAERLKGTKVTVNAMHPGFVATNFGMNNGLMRLLKPVTRIIALSPDEGAKTSIYLATSPEVENVTGKYFYKQKAVKSSDVSYNKEDAKKLWKISEELTGLKD